MSHHLDEFDDERWWLRPPSRHLLVFVSGLVLRRLEPAGDEPATAPGKDLGG